jgi:hypothetical protein
LTEVSEEVEEEEEDEEEEERFRECIDSSLTVTWTVKSARFRSSVRNPCKSIDNRRKTTSRENLTGAAAWTRAAAAAASADAEA